MEENKSIAMVEHSLVLLKKAKTLKDMEKVSDQFIELVLGAFQNNLDELKAINELPDNERAILMEAAFERNTQLEEKMNEVDQESMRFNDFPGGSDLLRKMAQTSMTKLGAIMEETALQVAILRGTEVEEAIESMAEGFKDAFAEEFSGPEEDELERELDVAEMEEIYGGSANKVACPECGFMGYAADVNCMACGKELAQK